MNKKTLKKLALGTAMLVAASSFTACKKAAAQPQTLILTTVLRLY